MSGIPATVVVVLPPGFDPRLLRLRPTEPQDSPPALPVVPALTSSNEYFSAASRARSGVDVAGGGEHLQCPDHDGGGVDVEEAAGGGPGVGEAVAVGAEGGERVGQELADLVGHLGDVVGGGDDRSGGVGEFLGHVRHPGAPRPGAGSCAPPRPGHRGGVRSRR